MIGQFHSNLPNFALIKIKLQLSNSLIKADWERRLKLKGEEETNVYGISHCHVGTPRLGEGTASCVESTWNANRQVGRRISGSERVEGNEKGAKICVFPSTETSALLWPLNPLSAAPPFLCGKWLWSPLYLPCPCLCSASRQPVLCLSPANVHGPPIIYLTLREFPQTHSSFHYYTSLFLLQWDSPSGIWVHLLFIWATLLWTKYF